ncbi:hypothetical protein AXX17_AT5G14730 [Arabidopsis thaliana]|uniref:Uncharacterized protein n=1 Tax=Arabidopsis thaliana TaxID=3702 RepID=A0A178UDM4_ARATH|nr:hypothetical protein AXX17_AT5G14730 [Arabidopsis thaliana]
MSEDKDYMSEPFIVKKIDDEESLLDDYNPQGNTSFSKTCFHGINALSDWCVFQSYILFLYLLVLPQFF